MKVTNIIKPYVDVKASIFSPLLCRECQASASISFKLSRGEAFAVQTDCSWCRGKGTLEPRVTCAECGGAMAASEAIIDYEDERIYCDECREVCDVCGAPERVGVMAYDSEGGRNLCWRCEEAEASDGPI